MLKPITLTALKLAALLHIEINGSTTSLDVKNILRANGVSANQQDVSELLIAAKDQLPLSSTTNGMYNVYSLPDPDDVVAANSITAPNPTNVSFALSYIKRDGTNVVGTDDPSTLKNNDWIVSGNTLNDDKNIYFDGSYTRDEVRFAFAKLRNVEYHETRAKRN